MKTEIRERARVWALEVLTLAHTEYGSKYGDCEDCPAAETKLFYAGCGFTCHKCYTDSLYEWEQRGGFSSESLFDRIGFNGSPEESSRLYRVAMASYWATLEGGK